MPKSYLHCLVLILFLYATHSSADDLNKCNYKELAGKKIQTPFLEIIKHKGHTLYFIGANHGEEDANKETFDLIRKVFDQYKFKRVVVESLETIAGINSKQYLSDIKTGKRRMGEPAFLATLASQKNIDFIGGEVSNQETIEYLKQFGFNSQDMTGIAVLKTWEARPELTIEKIITDLRYKNEFKDMSAFTQWFKKMYNNDLPSSRDLHISKPFQGRTDKLQELLDRMTFLRDLHLSKLIKKSLDENDSILIVYGSGHFYIQECLLRTE